MKTTFSKLGAATLASIFVVAAGASASPLAVPFGALGNGMNPAVSYAQEHYYQDHDDDRDRDRGWEAPPQELQDVARRGFHDGVEGARKDYENHRRPDVRNRDEYRHPDMPRRDRRAYRQGFERGYNVGVEHIYNRR
jgi:hypothetical protein